MREKASGQRQEGIASIDMDNGGKNASGDHIIGCTESYENDFAVPLFGYKETCELRYKYLKERYGHITQLTFRKKIQLEIICQSQE